MEGPEGVKTLREKLKHWRRVLPYAGILVLLGVLLYSHTMHYPFVYDDDAFVVLNESLHDLKNPTKFFTQTATLAYDQALAHDNYRPLTPLSYAVNYAFGELNPFGYHLVNLIFHILNALLLFVIALKLFRATFPANPRPLTPNCSTHPSFSLVPIGGEGRGEGALENDRKTLQVKIYPRGTLFNMGTAILKAGEYKEAIKALEAAVGGSSTREKFEVEMAGGIENKKKCDEVSHTTINELIMRLRIRS